MSRTDLASTSISRIPRQAETDAQLVSLWLHGKSDATKRAYSRDVESLLRATGKTLIETTLADLQEFENSISDLSPASRGRTLASIKSLLSFGQRVGYLAFNVGAAISLPKLKDSLSERILDERQVVKLIALEPSKRNQSILECLYFSGARISELCDLRWKDVQTRDSGGQLTLFGKGGKTRVVLLPSSVFDRLTSLRGSSKPEEPVFVSRLGKPISREQVHVVVKSAARRAGIEASVSAHWLRHAHASHALDNGAPVHLVQSTLGHASLTTTSRYTHARPNDSSAFYLRG